MSFRNSEEIVCDVAGGGPLPDDWVKLPPAELRRPEITFRTGKREFCVFDAHFLEIIDRTFEGERARTFNLTFFDPSPIRSVRLPWSWWAGSVALMTGGAAIASIQPLSWAGLALIVAGTILLACGVYHGATRLVFVSQLGRAPLLSIDVRWIGGRNAASFSTWIQDRIGAAKCALPPGSRRLAIEVAEHRRLLNEGSLAEADYERAKRRMLANFKTT